MNQANPTTGSRDKVVAVVTGLWSGDPWNRDLISHMGQEIYVIKASRRGTG